MPEQNILFVVLASRLHASNDLSDFRMQGRLGKFATVHMCAQCTVRPGTRLAPIVHHHLAHDVGKRQFYRAHGAVGNHAGTRLDPLGLQHRYRLFQARGFDHDVGSAHARFPVFSDDDFFAKVAREFFRKRIAALGAARMHADFIEMEDRVEQAHVPVGGAARADVAEHFGVPARQMPRANRRHCAGAHVGDVGGIDDRHRGAGFRVEQIEDGQFGRQADFVVAVIVADDFHPGKAERADVATQHVEVAGGVLLRRQVHARLDGGLTPRLRNQCTLDGTNDFCIGHCQCLHIGMIQVVQINFSHAGWFFA